MKKKKSGQVVHSFDKETDDAIKMSNKNHIQKKHINAQQEKMKNKKKKKIKRIITSTLKLLVFIGVIAGLLSFLLISPVFNIKNIEILNNNKISQETIISISTLNTQQNIFRFNKSEIVAKIEEEPYIESASISRVLPDKIKIDIKERVVKYCVQIVGKYVYIDSQGYILEVSDVANEMILLEGIVTGESEILPGNRLIQEDLEKIEDITKIINSAIQNDIQNSITSINIADSDNYTIMFTEDAKVVYFGDTSNITEKIVYTKAILEAEREVAGNIYVNGDFNNGFKPYFRTNV